MDGNRKPSQRWRLGREVPDQRRAARLRQKILRLDEPGLFDGGANVVEIVPLGDAQFNQVDVASSKPVGYFPYGGGFVETILARLPALVRAKGARGEQMPAGGNDARVGQAAGHLHGAGAFGEFDETIRLKTLERAAQRDDDRARGDGQ